MKLFHWLLNNLDKLFTPLFKKRSLDKKPESNVLQPILNKEGNYIFYCPGCEVNHLVSTVPKVGTYHTLTGSLAKPTIRASVMVLGNKKRGVDRCHSFITDGVIEYLDDCTHALAGKKIPMEPI